MTETEEFIRYLNSIHGRTRAVIALIPADKVNWTSQPGKFTLGDLVRHLALIERNMFVRTVLGEQSAYRGCGPEYGATYNEIVELFDRLHVESVEIIQRFDTTDFDRKCTTPAGAQISVRKWLRAMIEHEIHHRAQLYMYLAMLHIKTPPLFGLTSEEVIERAG